jgi:hypothetical protein
LAAVDATDCAMDGTVSCAKREDGRPDFTGMVFVTGAGAGAGGVGAITCTGGLTFVSATTGGVLAEIGLDNGFTAATLVVAVFTIGAFAGFTTVAADFLAATDTLEATAAGAALLAVLAVFGSSAATAFAFLAVAAGFNGEAGLFAALATGSTVALALAGVALFVLAFTFCLLTETRGVLLRGVWFPALGAGAGAPGPSARECTGIPKGKPIICNSVTNMANLRKIVF